MANDKVKFVDDKHVYDEETAHLNIVERKIDAIYNHTWNTYLSLKEEVETFIVYDWDDRDRLMGLKPIVEPTKRLAESYLFMKPNPYFMRVDIESGGKEIKKYYIGEKSLIENNTCYIIHDWRNPMLYEARFTRNKSFKVEKQSYELYLRRAIDIRNQRIENINTEFDSDALILGGNVIDPFLLSVLRDKRRNKKLTNIIKTIQQNQSEIINKPIEENFVVQGCAGSGKTMLLLHRLSYLLHNYKEYTVEKYCILTPNEFFNLHINDLSKDLEIDRIKRFTVERYYEELIGRMSSENSKMSSSIGGSIVAAKIKVLDEQLISEKSLDESLLTEIYSDVYRELLTKVYYDLWNDFNAIFDKNEYPLLEKLSTKTIPDITGFNYETYRNLDTYYSKLNSIIHQNEKELVAAQEGVEICLKNIDDYKKNIDDSCMLVPTLRNKIKSKLNDTLSLCNADEERLRLTEEETLSELEEFEERKDRLKFEIGNAFTDDERIMTDDELVSFEYITKVDTSYTLYIKSKMSSLISNIEDLYVTLKKVPFYNFGKKSNINKQIESKIEEYQKNTLVLLNEYKSTINTDLISLQTELRTLDVKIDERKRYLKEVQVERRVNKAKYTKLVNANVTLESDNIGLINTLVDESTLSFLKRDIKKLAVTLSSIETSKRDIVNQEKKLNEYQKIIDKCNNKNIDEAVKTELNGLKSKIDVIDIKNIWDSFETKLKETYGEYNQSYNGNQKYRHKLYIMLYMCFLYYGKPNNIEKFINIDEAQDIAISEYRLLRDVLGETSVFNMYGDVNQLIYTYKGITDWDEINRIVPLNLYFLNENYRNTVQITNYCNKVFGAEIVAIGISGEEVKTRTTKTAMADIQSYHRLNPKSRAAIIYKKGYEDLVRKTTNMLFSNEYVVDSVDGYVNSLFILVFLSTCSCLLLLLVWGGKFELKLKVSLLD